MAYIADSVFDNGLLYLQANGSRLDITSAEATTYSEATGSLSLGNDSVTLDAPSDGASDGRRVVVPNVVSGSVTGTGDVAFWALTNGTDELLATGAITPQTVTSGNTFSLTPINITLRDATPA